MPLFREACRRPRPGAEATSFNHFNGQLQDGWQEVCDENVSLSVCVHHYVSECVCVHTIVCVRTCVCVYMNVTVCTANVCAHIYV